MKPDLTYPEVGATGGVLPSGYHHLEAQKQIGSGTECFRTAAQRLLRWQMQLGAGLRVEGREVVELGDDAVVVIKIGPVPIRAPVRIVALIDEPTEIGFVYGTLPGHPESGEERFTVHLRPDDTVWATIRAFSRPGRWFARLGGPITRLVQRRTTERYLAALIS